MIATVKDVQTAKQPRKLSAVAAGRAGTGSMRVRCNHARDVGQVISERRADLNLTQQQVANAIGIKSNEFIAYAQRNARKIPLDKAAVLADVLLVDRWDLFKLVVKSHSLEAYQDILSNMDEPPEGTPEGEIVQVKITRDVHDHLKRLRAIKPTARKHIIEMTKQLYDAQVEAPAAAVSLNR